MKILRLSAVIFILLGVFTFLNSCSERGEDGIKPSQTGETGEKEDNILYTISFENVNNNFEISGTGKVELREDKEWLIFNDDFNISGSCALFEIWMSEEDITDLKSFNKNKAKMKKVDNLREGSSGSQEFPLSFKIEELSYKYVIFFCSQPQAVAGKGALESAT